MGFLRKLKIYTDADDWINLGGFVAMMLFFFVGVGALFPPNTFISTEEVPYDYTYATAATSAAGRRTCHLIGLPSDWQSCAAIYWASYLTFPCTAQTLCGAGDNDLTFGYTWVRPQALRADCFSARAGQQFQGTYLGFDMNKYSRVALPLAQAGIGLTPYKWGFIWARNDTNLQTAANMFWKADTTAGRPLPAALLAGYANVYLSDAYNQFGVGLADVLTRYNLNLGTLELSDLNHPELYVQQVRAHEATINTLPGDPAVPPPNQPAPPYNFHISNQMAACHQAANMQMSCQSAVQEGNFDYVIRIFGYTFFIQLGVMLIILVLHGWQTHKKRSSASSSSSSVSPRLNYTLSSTRLSEPLISRGK